MKRLWVIAFLFFANLYAATPLTHLYLADKWAQNLEISELEKTLLLKGSVFPDIRYIAHIPRSTTHKTGITLKEIALEENPFMAGCLLHCYIDEKREKLACEAGVYNLIQEVAQDHMALFLKLLEDEFLYTNCQPSSYQNCFTSLYYEELTHNISKTVLNDWNILLKIYLDEKPSLLLITFAQENQFLFGFAPSILYKWSREIPRLVQHPQIQHYITKMLKTFTEEFEDFLK